MAIGDVYSFTLRGHVMTEETVNVFHYEAFTSGDIDLDACATAFNSDVMTPLLAIIGASATYESLEIKQVVGGFAYLIDTYVAAVPGTASGEMLPPAVCWTFRYGRTQLGRRHGYKRIAGVTESYQIGGVPTPSALTALGTVALALEADLVPLSGISLRPVILHRMLNGQEVIPPVPQNIEGVHYSHMGTQNSRKFGHGR